MTHNTRESAKKVLKEYYGYKGEQDVPDGLATVLEDWLHHQLQKARQDGYNAGLADSTSKPLLAIEQMLQKAREEERERIEAIFKEHVPPHAMDLEDSVWLKRLLNKAFGHD